MRIEVEDASLEAPLRGIEATLQDHGGYVADDLIVRERGGQFSCAIGTRYGEPGRILLSYDPALRTPLSRIDWASDGSLRPTGGLTGLTTPQRALLEAWLELVLHTGKLEQVRAAYPDFSVTSWPLRQHLAAAGFPSLLAESTDVDVRTQLFRSHSALAARPRNPPACFLIPLKHLVNHDPTGADQLPLPGRTALATSRSSDATETFENYGAMDALQLLMNLGFVSRRPDFVHSAPVTVESTTLGRIHVAGRPKRAAVALAPDAAVAPDVPLFLVRGDGVDIAHLTIRAGNRATVSRLIAMAIRSRGNQVGAAAEAEQLLDDVLTANQSFYQRMDDLLVDAIAEAKLQPSAQSGAPATGNGSVVPSVLLELAAVSKHQQQLLQSSWR